jgi:hypothetical protein
MSSNRVLLHMFNRPLLFFRSDSMRHLNVVQLVLVACCILLLLLLILMWHYDLLVLSNLQLWSNQSFNGQEEKAGCHWGANESGNSSVCLAGCLLDLAGEREKMVLIQLSSRVGRFRPKKTFSTKNL